MSAGRFWIEKANGRRNERAEVNPKIHADDRGFTPFDVALRLDVLGVPMHSGRAHHAALLSF